MLRDIAKNRLLYSHYFLYILVDFISLFLRLQCRLLTFLGENVYDNHVKLLPLACSGIMERAPKATRRRVVLCGVFLINTSP